MLLIHTINILPSHSVHNMDYIHPFRDCYDRGRKIMVCDPENCIRRHLVYLEKSSFQIHSNENNVISQSLGRTYLKLILKVKLFVSLNSEHVPNLLSTLLKFMIQALFLGMSKWKNWIKVISQISYSNNSNHYLLGITFNVFGIFLF